MDEGGGLLASSVLSSDPLEHTLQIRHVVVPECEDACAGEVAPVLDGEVHILRVQGQGTGSVGCNGYSDCNKEDFEKGPAILRFHLYKARIYIFIQRTPHRYVLQYLNEMILFHGGR